MSLRSVPSLLPEARPAAHDIVPVSAAQSSPLGGVPPTAQDAAKWDRILAALRRHAPLVIAVTLAGSAIGYLASRRVEPLYDAQATVWINSSSAQQSGPIRAQELLPSASWVELLRSFAIVDPVVRRLNLNLSYDRPADSTLFRSFVSGPRLRPGEYTLRVARDGRTWALSTEGREVERGAVGDSVGRRAGFLWVPESRALTPNRSVTFSVVSPRTTSVQLLGRMRSTIPDGGQFLTIVLSGADPVRTTRTANAILDQFVASSTELKKRHLVEFRQALAGQLATSERELHRSENQLEQFRVNTITLPSGVIGAAGAGQAMRDPVLANFFQQKANADDIRSDRVALEQMLAGSRGKPLNTQALLMLPGLLNNTPQLRSAIEELSLRQAALRSEQQFLTDANPRIKQLTEAVRVLELQTIPQIARNTLASLTDRERSLTARINTQSQELRAIPSRTIEEMRLARQVTASENLYNSLKARYEEVSLAEAEITPDLSVLDSAVVPLRPSTNDGPRLVLLAVLASFGLATGLALVHDRLDRRFRYPEQATTELGLHIMGTVPRLNARRRGRPDVAALSQTVESFRAIRLALRYAFVRSEPVVFAVSSPGAGDGKSLVSSNLALAFASAGERTLLIDGDLRCGTQHDTFAVNAAPGLADFLNDGAAEGDVVRSTASPKLFLMPCGKRRTRAPELLVSPRMGDLVHRMREQFDVVIIDCPPFVAGMDAYALGAAAGSMLVVLRHSVTDRKLAAAKLDVIDRLPIRLLGTVLNSVDAEGMYRYYGHDYNYGGRNGQSSIGDVATPSGLVLRA